MSLKYGIIGATGIVGREINNLLLKNNVSVNNIKLFASKNYNSFEDLGNIKKFDLENLNDIDILFSCVNKDFSKINSPKILDKYKNIKIIDNSSAFRYEDDIPLVVPEINSYTIKKDNRLIANPNCTTAISVLALSPIDKLFNIKKIIMSTYQAASGAGKEGMEELIVETKNYFDLGHCGNKVFQYSLPFNIIPHIDNFHENGYTNEEMKVVKETKKILENKDIKITCTAVRIPIVRSHSMAITVETEKKIDYNLLNLEYQKLNKVIDIKDDPNKNIYPMPILSTNNNSISIGRIRPSLVFDKGCELFVCGDQILRGAALNSVLISELFNKN